PMRRGHVTCGQKGTTSRTVRDLHMIGVAIPSGRRTVDWLAFVLVGLAPLIMAGGFQALSKNLPSKMNLKPERTMASLHADEERAQEQTRSLKEEQA
ncbi:MAG TPA: phage holin family protein, partial [Thermomicrobiales bacterium]|nr:phage holin family protein [Thermomicrobiales bacterium]